MKLIERTFKMVIATLMAILIAQLLNVNNAYAAGIIAILSVLDTRLDTVKVAVTRFLSTLLAFLIAWCIFSIGGYSVWNFAIFLMIYIPFSYYSHVQVGIAPSAVLVTHFIAAESVSFAMMLNGGLLMLVGIGSALLLNVWMPSQMHHLNIRKEEIEQSMIEALKQMSLSLRQIPCDVRFIQQNLRKLENQLEEAQQIALIEYNNNIFQKDDYLLNYFAMRQTQAKILKGLTEMLPNIPLGVIQGEMLANLLLQTAEQFGEHNTGIELIEGVAALYRYSKQSDLPKTRAEFESRAMIYAFLIEFNRLLEVKREFYEQYLMK